MSEIYSGAAQLGRISAIVTAVIFTVIGLILIITGIYLLVSKSEGGSRKASGIISIVFGILFILIPWLWVLLTKESKPIAALQGVSTGIDIVRSL